MKMLPLALVLWPALAWAHPCDRDELIQQRQNGTKTIISACLAGPVTDWLITVDGKKSLLAMTKTAEAPNAEGLQEYTGAWTFTLGLHKVGIQPVVAMPAAPVYDITVVRKGTL